MNYPISSLTVVAYTDPPVKGRLPQVVPVVYLIVNSKPARYVIPPYRQESEHIVGVESSEAEFLAAIERGTVVRLQDSVPALPDHRLWLDEKSQPHYQQNTIVLEALKKGAREQLARALVVLRSGQFEKAILFASKSLHGSEVSPIGLAVGAAGYQLTGQGEAAEAIRDAALDLYPHFPFDDYLECLLASVAVPSFKETAAEIFSMSNEKRTRQIIEISQTQGRPEAESHDKALENSGLAVNLRIAS